MSNFLEDLEREVRASIRNATPEETEEFVKYMKEMVLKSYKNGLRDGRKPKGGARPSKGPSEQPETKE